MYFEKIEKNNKVLFKFDDETVLEKSELNEIEQDLLDKFDLSIKGQENTVIINLKDRGDLMDFFKKEGLYIAIVGFKNEINLGKVGYGVNPRLNITGLQIYIGGEADSYIDASKLRYASNCKVIIGDNTNFCGTRIYLQDDNSSVNIGKDCMFSWGIDCWCSDIHTILDMEGNIINYGKFIEIADHCWIGKDCKIGKNTKISKNSIVGWQSVVTKQFDEENVIIAGNPAKIVKRDIDWNQRDIQNYKLYKSEHC